MYQIVMVKEIGKFLEKQIGNKFSLKCINIYGSFKKEKLDKMSDDLIFVIKWKNY